ncbi:hypothetical protein VOLCADRAFT_117894, partial [Volvox carteri f. nagariensis]
MTATATVAASWCPTLELLARVLQRAPGLQELALLRVTVLPPPPPLRRRPFRVTAPRPHPEAAAAAAAAARAVSDAGGDAGGDGLPGATGWCSVFWALPTGLTSLRLGLLQSGGDDRPTGHDFDIGGALSTMEPRGEAADVPKWQHRACGSGNNDGGECGNGCGGGGGVVDQLCAACLGAALRRLPRLSSLELSGVSAPGALRALQLATARATAAVESSSRRGGGGGGDAGASTAAVQQHQQQQPPPASLAALERLVLDLEGLMDLGSLKAVVVGGRGLPRLRHLIVAEQRAIVPSWPSTGLCRHRVGPDDTYIDSHGGGDGGDKVVTEEQFEEEPFSPLDSVLWMLRQPQLRRLSFTSDRAFTTLQRPPPPPPHPSPHPSSSSSTVGSDGDGGRGGGSNRGDGEAGPYSGRGWDEQ